MSFIILQKINNELLVRVVEEDFLFL